MNFFRVAFRPETAKPMLALMFASGTSLALVAARVVWTGKMDYAALGWNLFLAWLPLVFAFLAGEEYRAHRNPNWRFYAFAVAWLLFFPNAPYIFTDLTHLTTRYYGHFWVDMVLILLCAMTGLILGFLSLFLMQGVVARMFGRVASWLFIAAIAVLSSFGIYLGRFLRLNSWDVLFKPIAVYHGIGQWADNPLAQSNSYAFPALFAIFLFVAYLMLYGLTQLQPAQLANRAD
jgi:uncharacterized membrane protein